MRARLLKYLLDKAAKVSKIDPADALTQMNTDDLIHILKELVL